MEMTIRYMIDWCTSGTMTVDFFQLIEIGLKRGGFSKAKTKKLLKFFIENADDDTREALRKYTEEKRRFEINLPLCQLILEMLEEVY